MKNIVLTGPRGSGKTTVGKAVAKILGCSFVDTDEVIEKQFGISIREIFERFGEAEFRKAEAQLAVSISNSSVFPAKAGIQKGSDGFPTKSGKTDALIISTGGGMMIPAENRVALSENSVVFCLNASPSTIQERIGGDESRPLYASDSSPSPRLHSMRPTLSHEGRGEIYSSFFHQIQTDNRTPESIAKEIICKYELESQFDSEYQLYIQSSHHETYPVFIESSLFDRMDEFVQFLNVDPDQIVVVTQEKLQKLYGIRIDDALNRLTIPHSWIVIPDGEKAKDLNEIAQIYEQLSKANVSRKTLLIAFGGGVVGDVTGYAAATYMRGIPFIQIPTSLLAMVDSSVGGKCGVNFGDRKNLIGSFYTPKGVLIDPQLIMSLPVVEYQCGMAEVIKHAIIGDLDLWQMLQDPEETDLEKMIYQSICVKAHIVQQDYRESGQRMLLNLGHTFGHAIEALSNYQIKHGHAVAMGMCMAADYALAHNKCDPALPGAIRETLKKHGLPTQAPDHPPEKIWATMKQDKKTAHNQVRLVLPASLGCVVLA